MTLRADGISVRIGRATLLADVSVALEGGEVVVVVGPNGAGKTTLIGTLAGDTRPAQGQVTLDDRPMDRWSAAELAARRAVMGTGGDVAFGFSAREVALLGRGPMRAAGPADHDAALIDALLDAVDCTDLADRVFSTLSTGERQRVQLARAIAQVSDAGEADREGAASGRPDGYDAGLTRFLLLDEPTSSLDPAHQHSAMRLLRSQATAGRGVLAVLHDLNLAAAYADRIVLMKDAGVVATGTPDRVLDAALLESVFDVPMLVVAHPTLAHPVVVAHPR